MRRFTFKLEFLPLDADQRWDMFLNETGLKAKADTLHEASRQAWWEALVFMPPLTAGDFATVKRQCLLLGQELTPQQWVEQLAIECAMKVQERRQQESSLR